MENLKPRRLPDRKKIPPLGFVECAGKFDVWRAAVSNCVSQTFPPAPCRPPESRHLQLAILSRAADMPQCSVAALGHNVAASRF